MSERKQRLTFVGTLFVALLVFVLAFGVASCGSTKKGGGGGGSGDGQSGGGGGGGGDGQSGDGQGAVSMTIEAHRQVTPFLC